MKNIAITTSDRMSSRETRAAVSLAFIYAVRMLGLFMVLPVFALYAERLQYSTAFLIGLALGAYGFTQALLQIPFGMASDRYGRKPLLIAGLLIFAGGSLLAALSDSIYGVIAGRALQGAGAIAAVIMALAADVSREQHRTKMMALIGASIGASFMLALVLGPYLNNYIGVPGLFGLTAVLAFVAIGLVIFCIPQSPQILSAERISWRTLRTLLHEDGLWHLNLGILLLHSILTASFIALPYILRDTVGVPESHQWRAYLGVLLLSLLLALPLIVLADRWQRSHHFMLAAIAALVAALWLIMQFATQSLVFYGGLVLYFAAFNLLEASLPAMVSKAAPVARKGAALGIYSSSQFLGAFLGGITGGALLAVYGPNGVLSACSLIAMGWFALAGFFLLRR